MDARVSASDPAALVSGAAGDAPALLPAADAGLGGGLRTPALNGPFARFRAAARESVWTPVALKATSIALGMLGLAAIGAWSTLAGAGTAPAPNSPHASAPIAVATAAPASAAPATPASAPADPAKAAAPGTTPDGKVILNTATVGDLTKLPRIGEKRAQAILDLRRRLGKFRQATDLLRVRGIGRKTLRQLLPLLVVDPPAPAKTD